MRISHLAALCVLGTLAFVGALSGGASSRTILAEPRGWRRVDRLFLRSGTGGRGRFRGAPQRSALRQGGSAAG